MKVSLVKVARLLAGFLVECTRGKGIYNHVPNPTSSIGSALPKGCITFPRWLAVLFVLRGARRPFLYIRKCFYPSRHTLCSPPPFYRRLNWKEQQVAHALIYSSAKYTAKITLSIRMVSVIYNFMHTKSKLNHKSKSCCAISNAV